jgi:hypothetical protein
MWILLLGIYCSFLLSVLLGADISRNRAEVSLLMQDGEGRETLFSVDLLTEDILHKVREACRKEGLTEVVCVQFLDMVVSTASRFVTEEPDRYAFLAEGLSTNAILIRNHHGDEITGAMLENKEKSDAVLASCGGYGLYPPLKVFYHKDETNNLGDLWTTFLFSFYSEKVGSKRVVDSAKHTSTTFVTSVGSTLQWLFNKHTGHDEYISNPSETLLLDHLNSGLRTSIGNGFIRESDESALFPTPLVDIVGVRGPLTRGLLNRNLGLYPPVISDPGLLAPRLYPPPLIPVEQQLLTKKDVGFVVHESHRAIFASLFPELQDCLVDNHVFLNAKVFFEQLQSYKSIVSSSLHGIIFSHAYGIPVMPVVFSNFSSAFSESIIGGDFKYTDYYRSVGYEHFARRVPLTQQTFSRGGVSVEEKVRRLHAMASNYWQPTKEVIDTLQERQEGLIVDYLELYRDAYDPTLTLPEDCLALLNGATTATATENGESVAELKHNMQIRAISTIQEYYLRGALAELYQPDMSCPQVCVEQMNITAGISGLHRGAESVVNGVVVGVIFPRKLVTRVNRLSSVLGKTLFVNYIGKLSTHRSWVMAFDDFSHFSAKEKASLPLEYVRSSIVKDSNKGRTSRKYLFDYEYFNALAMSSFTLCPVGDYNWSYRLLEAVMAMSIPILSVTDVDDIHVTREGYFYYLYTPTQSQEEHERQVAGFIYLPEEAQRNYQLLLEGHVIGEQMADSFKMSTNCVY